MNRVGPLHGERFGLGGGGIPAEVDRSNPSIHLPVLKTHDLVEAYPECASAPDIIRGEVNMLGDNSQHARSLNRTGVSTVLPLRLLPVRHSLHHAKADSLRTGAVLAFGLSVHGFARPHQTVGLQNLNGRAGQRTVGKLHLRRVRVCPPQSFGSSASVLPLLVAGDGPLAVSSQPLAAFGSPLSASLV